MTKDDLISRQAAIEVIDAVMPVDPNKSEYASGIACGAALAMTYVKQLPPAQPEPQSRIEKELHGLTPKQQYNFLDSLMHKKSVGWNSTALYVTAWLAGEED